MKKSMLMKLIQVLLGIMATIIYSISTKDFMIMFKNNSEHLLVVMFPPIIVGVIVALFKKDIWSKAFMWTTIIISIILTIGGLYGGH